MLLRKEKNGKIQIPLILYGKKKGRPVSPKPPSTVLTGLASPGRFGLRARDDDGTILSQTAPAWEIRSWLLSRNWFSIAWF